MFSIYRLANQLPDEKVIKIIHRDLFILFKRVVYFLLFMVLIVGFVLLVNTLLPDLMSSAFAPLVVLVVSAYVLFIWLFFFFAFIEYYLDVWIITNERIISIEQEGFFARVISEQRLFRIQDVTSEMKGVWSTIFSFGYVFVQTAGEKERFDFEQVPNPDEIRDLIIKLAEIDREKQTQEIKAEQGGVL